MPLKLYDAMAKVMMERVKKRRTSGHKTRLTNSGLLRSRQRVLCVQRHQRNQRFQHFQGPCSECKSGSCSLPTTVLLSVWSLGKANALIFLVHPLDSTMSSNLKLVIGSLYNSFSHHVRVIAFAVENTLRPPLPPLDWALAPCAEPVNNNEPASFDKVKELLDEIFDPFLLAVQKKIRSVRKVRARRYGVDKYTHGCHIIRPKVNIIPCHTCGHDMLVGYLCEKCYQKNVEETKVIQKAMIQEFGFSPIEQDIAPLYKGEEPTNKPGFRFVPIEKERPAWFSSNLTSRSTASSEQLPGDVIADDSKKQ